MSKLLFFTAPLAAAGLSTWTYHRRSRASKLQSADFTIDATPTYFTSKYPPADADTAIYPPPAVLQLLSGPLRGIRSTNPAIRRRTASALAQLSDLEDQDFGHLASQISHQTALLLASWKTPNLRLLTAPPSPRSNDSVELRLRHMIEALPAPEDECAAFVTALALRHLPPADWSAAPISSDCAEIAAPQPWRTRRPPTEVVVKSCVEALISHASDQNQLNVMLQSGLLELLSSTHWDRPRDPDMTGLLGQLIGHVTSIAALHTSGWLALLSAWSREQDVRVSLPAWRALRNLVVRERVLENGERAEEEVPVTARRADAWLKRMREGLERLKDGLGMPGRRRDQKVGGRQLQLLPDGVFLLHPQNVTAESLTELDVIFVHGLLGGTSRTWRQHDAVKEALGGVRECRKSETVLRRRREMGAKGRWVSDGWVLEEGDVKGESCGRSCDPSLGSDVDTRSPAVNDGIDGELGAARRVPDKGNGSSSVAPSTTERNDSTKEEDSDQIQPDATTTHSQKTAEAFSSDATTCASTPPPSSPSRYTQCWPKDWLPGDLPLRVRVLSVDYDTSWTEWRPRCSRRRGRTLKERARELRKVLVTAGVGDRPIVWVTHSMGGLIVKQMLVDEAGGRDGGEGGDGVSGGEKSIEDRGCTVRSVEGLGDRTRTVDSAGHRDGLRNENKYLIPGSGDIEGNGSGSVGYPSTRGQDVKPPSTCWVGNGASADAHKMPSEHRDANSGDGPLLAATRGVVFYSCPHLGSRVASVSPPLRPILLPSSELDSLRPDSPHLRTLSAAFLSLCHSRGLSCLSIAETQKQKFLGREVMFVEPASAALGTGRLVLADADHLSVCKPRGRDSELYRLTVEFIKDVSGED